MNTIDTCMDMPDCMIAEEMRSVTMDDDYLSRLSEYLFHSWASKRPEVQKDLHPYWSFRDEIVIIDDTAIKGKRKIMPVSLQERN